MGVGREVHVLAIGDGSAGAGGFERREILLGHEKDVEGVEFAPREDREGGHGLLSSALDKAY